MSCGVGDRRGSDPALLWLWCRPAATALIRPLAQELPHATGEVVKRKRKRKEIHRSKNIGGVPIAAQWLRTQLVSIRMQVRSLALLSGVRI